MPNKTLKSIDFKHRCKNGTQKYKPLGNGCFEQEEIDNVKVLFKKRKWNKQLVELIIEEPPPVKKMKKKAVPLLIVEEELNIKTIEPVLQKKKLTKRRLKTLVELEIMESKRYNEEFIDLMEKLNNIMLKRGEPFRARAYQKAQETLMTFKDDITSPSQLKGLPNIGTTVMDKLNEYVETGTLRILEDEKTNPANVLAEIYGIGPKKASDLVVAGIKTVDDLRSRQDELLNDVQKVGLKYHDEIMQRIPRAEIEEFNDIFSVVFDNIRKKKLDARFEIVGSFRRGASTSGDIDVIITDNNKGYAYTALVDELIAQDIILEVLSRGPSKTLVIARLPEGGVARRVDFLYAPPDEFAFAILYFTGSKIFNTVMRQYALDKGYTFNEHGIYHLENKKKGAKVDRLFRTEEDIFAFLGLEFKVPVARGDGRAVVPYMDVGDISETVAPTLDAPTQIAHRKKPAKLDLIIVDDDMLDNAVLANLSKTDAEQLIEQFKHNGIGFLESLNENQLTNILRTASDKYYNDTPIMTDNQFDIVKEYVEQKYPNNTAISEIGAEVVHNKVKLPFEMPSMEKIKPDTNALSSWMKKYKGPSYVLSCKLDGTSLMYTTVGTTPKLYTRGNGKIGKDVSHLIPFLRLPKTKDIAIRGELIVPKEVFEQKYATDFANPRNMVAGIVNHKHINSAVHDARFVAYEVIKPFHLKPSEQMEYLKTLDVESVFNETVDTLSNDLLSDMLVHYRKNYMYEIDGIIVTDDKVYERQSGNPEHAFAFKMVLSDQVAEAKVVDVLWEPSKYGYLKPRVQIEPIYLVGVTITYATGFNASFIQDNKIGVGALIELIRSGDVIPHIRSVVVPADEAKMPNVPYHWNKTHVDIIIDNMSDDPIVKEKNITAFFRGIGVEGLSSGNVNRIIKAGYDTIPDIIKMTETDFLNVDGFKDKMAQKLYNGIKQKLEEATIVQLMASSTVFGRGFSEKKMELVLNELPDILVSNESDLTKIEAVASVKGMAIKSAEAFVLKIEDFKEFLTDCALEDKLYETKKVETVLQTHVLTGKTVVLTGTRDKTVVEFLKTVGATQGSSVSKNTFLVVAKNKNDDTGKAEEARKLNIPIMSVEEFVSTYVQ